MANPLQGIDGQLMVLSAHAYCLGRITYIVPSCTAWLRENWDDVTDKTRSSIVRDTVLALQNGQSGMAMDTAEWKSFAEWAWRTLSQDGQEWCIKVVAYNSKAWPLDTENDDE